MSRDDLLAPLYAALVDAAPEDVLAPLVEASGGVLESATREDVRYRPGRDAHLRYAASVRRGPAVAREGWVLAAGEVPPTPLALDAPLGRVSAWRVRDDPRLVGLGPALDRAVVAGLLGDLGLPDDGLVLELLAYRPQRRAVVGVRTSTHELYLKCVPPEDAALLHARHAACREAGVPVPMSVGHDDALGLVVLTPVRGTSLRPQLLADDGAVPPPEQVVALLDAFTAVQLDVDARSGLRQAKGHARLLRSLLPGEAGRLDDLLARVLQPGSTAELRVGVHGDLYDDQLLVEDGRTTGVVDVDGAGRGHPADDPANLLAHLHVLRLLAGPGAAVHRWAPALEDLLVPRHEPVELRRRTAAVLVGLATWPHSRQAPDWRSQTSTLLDLVDRVLSG